MTDLELETLKQMRELCAEQMERAPTSCEYVDWRNKSWIIEGILDDAKERRELEKIDELTSDDPEENETENVTENKTESEDIEMSTSEVNGVMFKRMYTNTSQQMKESLRKMMKYGQDCGPKFGVLIDAHRLTFFATNGRSVYFGEYIQTPMIYDEKSVVWFNADDLKKMNDMVKLYGKYPYEMSVAYDNETNKIVFKTTKYGNDHTEIVVESEKAAVKTDFLFKLADMKTATCRWRGVMSNAVQLAELRKKNSCPWRPKLSFVGGCVYLDGEKIEARTLEGDEIALTYSYDYLLPQVYSAKKTPVIWELRQSGNTFVYMFRHYNNTDFVLNTLMIEEEQRLAKLYPTDEDQETEKETATKEPVTEPTETAKDETETPTEKEKTGMTATEIKPAQETGNFTFSVSTSPTDFECIGLDYKPGIDLSKPTDKKTPEPVECKRPDLGEFIQGNKTYELYRNDELKRYRLTFKRHLTKDERDFLWTNKWTWRKEFKCYQWGFTKNGDEAARNAIEYFEKR